MILCIHLFSGVIYALSDTGIPCFLKILFILLHFKESPTLVPIFSTQKNSKEDFCFYEKKQKAKIAFSVCFLAGCYRGNVHPSQWKWPH